MTRFDRKCRCAAAPFSFEPLSPSTICMMKRARSKGSSAALGFPSFRFIFRTDRLWWSGPTKCLLSLVSLQINFLSHGKQLVRDVNPILSRRNLQRETWVGQMQRGSGILFKIAGEYNSFSSSPPHQHAIVKRVAKRERLAVEHRHRRFAVQQEGKFSK